MKSKAVVRPRSCKRVQIDCGGVSRTKQSFAESCDINQIVARAVESGQMPRIADAGEYRDVSGGLSYKESLAVVMNARKQFNELPAKVRARFGNDPAQFVGFLGDPANKDEAIKLGLVNAPKDPEPPAPKEPPAPPPAESKPKPKR